jgi:ATP-dependent helicase HrpB
VQNSLPIWEIHGQLLSTWETGNRVVLIAPTGSGKTTQVPQMFLDCGLAGSGKIVVLQPRRVAARTVAARVAWERGCKLGGEVGYQIRFEDATSLGTRICFVTEGILLRWLQDGGTLPDVGLVIFDEFHERNLLSDVALALVKRLQERSRPDLKVMVMSATLEAEPVAGYLGGCPILISEGQSFPVEIRYQKYAERAPLPEQAAEAVAEIIQLNQPGDILVFMPGMQEIQATIRACRSSRLGEQVDFIPLHGELPPEAQDRAFEPSNTRKVVVSTNVAETSVTIDGIRFVVDSGLARIARYDPERGIGTLGLEEISRASADQRKGRAGRTAPGNCLRLWTESNHLNRPARNSPEIQRADLAEVVLLLHSLGVVEAVDFDWLTSPDPLAVKRAEGLLWMLGAFNSEKGLSPIGRQMLRLPMHPRYSRMLLEAQNYECVAAAALCAALVSGRDFLVRLGRQASPTSEARLEFEASPLSDFFTLIRAYQFAAEQRFDLETCRQHGLHSQIGWQVAQTHQQLLEILANQKILQRPEKNASEEGLLRAIMTGFVDQLCLRKDKGTLDCLIAGNRTGVLARESVVQESPLFVAANIREIPAKGGSITLISLASSVKMEWLRESFAQLFKTSLEHVYDRTHKRVAAIRYERFLDLILSQDHQKDLDPNAAGICLAEAYRDGCFELPLFNHEIKQLIGRCNLVARTLPELDFPLFDETSLVQCIGTAFSGLTLAREAQTTPLRTAFLSWIGTDRLSWLDELAPLTIHWPDGRKLKLLYPEMKSETGEPEIQAKLHECFQLQEHPKVCDGKVSVRIWLAGPDGKRIEATTDWPKWRSAQYPKLKPGLLRKYPGMAWL